MARPNHLRRALVGATTALVSTCVATWAYGAVELRSYSPGILIYAPMWQSVVIGMLIGPGLGIARSRLRSIPFLALAAIVGGVVGYVAGEFLIGQSPHFSHDLAVAFFAAAWAVGAFDCACIVTVVPGMAPRQPA